MPHSSRSTPTLQIQIGDCRELLRALPSDSVPCVVTSPPYWQLRDYGVAGQIGLEPTLPEFIDTLIGVFTEIRRVLRPDGSCWMNLGDTYTNPTVGKRTGGTLSKWKGGGRRNPDVGETGIKGKTGLKPKQLCGIPWRVALSLQDEGWYLREDIIWSKPNPMPESARDRCTRAHDYLFHLTKSPDYYWDKAATIEPVTGTAKPRGSGVNAKAKAKTPTGWDTSTGEGAHGSIHRTGRGEGKRRIQSRQNESFSGAVNGLVTTRNWRSVWEIPTEPCPDAHFATFPGDLPRRCILASTRPGDLVLDPFGGRGTTGHVALELGRSALLLELNPAYAALAEAHCASATPGFGF